MGSSTLKVLFIPAIISLTIFLTITYALLPAWRRYRDRYSQYIPIERISHGTSGLRSLIRERFARWRGEGRQNDVDIAGGDELLDEGEELGAVDEDVMRRIREQARRARGVEVRRLSRDLEEGFRDDSSSDDTN